MTEGRVSERSRQDIRVAADGRGDVPMDMAMEMAMEETPIAAEAAGEAILEAR
jgi:hypothetical protein